MKNTIQYKKYKNILKIATNKILNRLNKVTPVQLLNRKNRWTFHIEYGPRIKAQFLAKSLFDQFAYISKDTILGKSFYEEITLSQQGIIKSEIVGIDFEAPKGFFFNNKEHYLLIQQKTGINWCNAGSYKNLMSDFKKAKDILNKRGVNNILCVEGIIGGNENHCHQKPSHVRICGTNYLKLITLGNEESFKELINFFKNNNAKIGNKIRNIRRKFVRSFICEFADKNGYVNWSNI